jgi:serine/threonine protein kinase
MRRLWRFKCQRCVVFALASTSCSITTTIQVHIHQSLRLHPNIVTLHRTLETSAFLLLLLEYVPGEDLFYFLEQSRDHYDLDQSHPTDSTVAASFTPPTPSLLSNLHPSHLLSRTRLRLIASMFSQMCDAVAACHAQQVFHRDIKPENFIVTDGLWTGPDGRQERKVIVKLTDFGLSTMDEESADMDCGSAPYMSYECRNNVAPTYRPRGADVWSLGIVLINMLYHYNPWTDTADGGCSSFATFLRDPVHFFMSRFAGMTRPVADTLANKVFCILDVNDDGSNPHAPKRMSAQEFGEWSRNLPTLLGTPAHPMHRTISTGSTRGHRLSLSIPMSLRPSSRQASRAGSAHGTPAIPVRTLSRAPSLEPPCETYEREELSTVIDNDNEDEVEGQVELEMDLDVDADAEEEEDGMMSRSTSTNKRRKRGARKGRGLASVLTSPLQISQPLSPQDTTLATLAVASQSLAREISMASKASNRSPSVNANLSPRPPSIAPSVAASSVSGSSQFGGQSRAPGIGAGGGRSGRMPYEPVAMYAVPTQLFATPIAPTPQTEAQRATSAGSTTSVVPTPVTKKPSKWKLSFGKNSAASISATGAASSPTTEEAPPPPSSFQQRPVNAKATTANNVTSLLMGLDASSASLSNGGNGNNNTGIINGNGNSFYGSVAASSSSVLFNSSAMGAAAAINNLSNVNLSEGMRSTNSLHQNQNQGKNNRNAANSTWSRGRTDVRDGVNSGYGNGNGVKHPSRSPGYALHQRDYHPPHHQRDMHHLHPHQNQQHLPVPNADRAISPHSTRRTAGAGSSASSVASGMSNNWRSSMSTTSSAGTSTSAFTRYSNSSTRSVSTTATSVSSASWRTSVKPAGSGFILPSQQQHPHHHGIPKNIKIMDGVPWELDQLPRGQHPNPVGDIFGSPPVRKQRSRKPQQQQHVKDSSKRPELDTITERPSPSMNAPLGSSNYTFHQHQTQFRHHQQQQNAQTQTQEESTSVSPPLTPVLASPTQPAKASHPLKKSVVPEYQRCDASTSTTDLSGLKDQDCDGVKKVQKGQINALAKMLSALRR